ncbi:MAG: VWA domain-containing protein [Candidatus Promineifilaceae bacterium]
MNESIIYSSQQERDRRWRLILGKTEEEQPQSDDGNGEAQPGEGNDPNLSEEDQKIDEALDDLYGEGDEGGLSDPSPDLASWLGNIRSYFDDDVAHMLERDALKKLKIRQLLKDPDQLATIEPNLELATQLLTLSRAIPTEAKETARQLVREVVDELRAQLEYPLQQAIQGSLNRAIRTRRPKFKEIDWNRTIHANLKHYQPKHNTIIPETLIGYGKQRESLRDVILCIDQSGSMMQSMVYASIFGAVMASLPSLKTHVVVFSSEVADLTDQLSDPVEALFGSKLRGGTNIDRAVAYSEQLVSRPNDTLFILITDLFEGNSKGQLVPRVAGLVKRGVQFVTLLALNDKGTPRFNRTIAQKLVDLGVPAFACTPALFPDLMGAALAKRDLNQWAASNGIVVAPHN